MRHEEHKCTSSSPSPIDGMEVCEKLIVNALGLVKANGETSKTWNSGMREFLGGKGWRVENDAEINLERKINSYRNVKKLLMYIHNCLHESGEILAPTISLKEIFLVNKLIVLDVPVYPRFREHLRNLSRQ